MNWEAIGAVGEVTGALAVLFTLFYLGMQIRQNSNAMRASTELEVSRQYTDFVRRLSMDDQLRKIWNKIADAPNSLNDDERARYLWAMSEFFHMSEGVFRQYKTGFLAHESWSEYERTLVGMLQAPLVRDWFIDNHAPFSREFRRHIESMIDSTVQWRQKSTPGASTEFQHHNVA